MDPVTLIVAAVVAGASAGLTDAIKGEVTRAYAALRTKLFQRFDDDVNIKSNIGALEADPGSPLHKSALEQNLKKDGIDQDDELIALAKSVATATGLDVKQIRELAKGATVLSSAQRIQGVTSQKVEQVQHAGENSRVENSDQIITFGPPED
ncbi:hypothetical protein [Mycetocola sp. 2940]|uniref:hypothetical protein n=1 Tax=Mycetocola sp. 2940 TaxID=3156452 RepID=UPI0033949A0E